MLVELRLDTGEVVFRAPERVFQAGELVFQTAELVFQAAEVAFQAPNSRLKPSTFGSTPPLLRCIVRTAVRTSETEVMTSESVG